MAGPPSLSALLRGMLNMLQCIDMGSSRVPDFGLQEACRREAQVPRHQDTSSPGCSSPAVDQQITFQLGLLECALPN